MKINRNNYEVFFLDYYENSLQPGQVAELMVFLEANPDLNSEFESFDAIKILPEEVLFNRKKTLNKQDYKSSQKINAFNYEQWMVSRLENDLSEEDILELKTFLKLNPDARLEYDLFKKTRLKPEDFFYENKSSLKKKGIYVLYRTEINIAMAIAASVLVFLGIFFSNKDQNLTPDSSRDNFTYKIESLEENISDRPIFPEISSRSEFTGTNKNLTGIQTLKTAPFDIIGGSITPTAMAEKNSVSSIPLFTDENYLLSIEKRNNYMNSPNETIASNQFKKEQTSFVRRFINGTFENLLGRRNTSKKSILEYTVDGYNLVADREIDVEKQYDSYGKLTAYQLNGEILKIGRKVNPGSRE